jgi:hypothetical protein
MGNIYTATFSAVAVTAAQDLFEILAPATLSIILHSVVITQVSDTDSEQIRFAIKRVTGSPTSGSGGSTVTPRPIVLGATFGGTVEANNTTRISGGTNVTLYEESQNILNGWYYLPTPEMRYEFGGATYCIVGLEAAPVDSLTISGTATFETIGGQ